MCYLSGIESYIRSKLKLVAVVACENEQEIQQVGAVLHVLAPQLVSFLYEIVQIFQIPVMAGSLEMAEMSLDITSPQRIQDMTLGIRLFEEKPKIELIKKEIRYLGFLTRPGIEISPDPHSAEKISPLPPTTHSVPQTETELRSAIGMLSFYFAALPCLRC